MESSLRRLALCPALGTAHCEVMELASKLWSWAQLHNFRFQKSPTVKFWSWAGFCQGRLCQHWHSAAPRAHCRPLAVRCHAEALAQGSSVS